MMEFLCYERYGPVLRGVTEVSPSPMVEAYLRSKLLPYATPIKDLSHIYSKGARIFLVDDVGMMMKGTIDYNGMPDVHVGFWDKILRGRESMAREVALMVAEDAGSRGVWTAIPAEARATLAFAKRVGFETNKEINQLVLLSLITR